ncbi:MAG: hypothetical protein RID91_03660 [Azospirillaceae bacterium]
MTRDTRLDRLERIAARGAPPAVPSEETRLVMNMMPRQDRWALCEALERARAGDPQAQAEADLLWRAACAQAGVEVG